MKISAKKQWDLHWLLLLKYTEEYLAISVIPKQWF